MPTTGVGLRQQIGPVDSTNVRRGCSEGSIAAQTWKEWISWSRRRWRRRAGACQHIRRSSASLAAAIAAVAVASRSTVARRATAPTAAAGARRRGPFFLLSKYQYCLCRKLEVLHEDALPAASSRSSTRMCCRPRAPGPPRGHRPCELLPERRLRLGEPSSTMALAAGRASELLPGLLAGDDGQ
ncbi:unnamed protein product [Urochloa humidicola]